jgi:two-component sensor histidine kinase
MQFFRIGQWRNWFIHPLVMAVPFAVLAILLLPDYFPKYQVSLLQSGNIDKPDAVEYQKDIDGDSEPEHVVFFLNTENQPSIKIIEASQKIGGQYYTNSHQLSSQLKLFFADADSSGTDEIYFFTKRNDSLLFYGIDHAGKKGFLFQDILIDTLPDPKSLDYQIERFRCTDVDGDGINEYLFALKSGFPLHPRGIALYDPEYNGMGDTVLRTPPMGVYFDINELQDINGDGKKEIFARTYSISNYPDTLGGTRDDHSAWIMVFDHKLNFLFYPIQFQGKYIWINTFPVFSGNQWKLISIITQRALSSIPPQMILSRIDGMEEKRVALDDSLFFQSLDLIQYPEDPGALMILDQSGTIYKIDSRLTLTPIKNDTPLQGLANLSEDLDHDNKMEHLIFNRHQTKLYITTHDFSDFVEISLPKVETTMKYSIAFLNPVISGIFIQIDNMYYLFRYLKSPLYNLKIPFYLSIYLILALILWLIQVVQKRVWLKQQANKNQIAALQLLLLKNQLGPHFTFNVISSITALIHLKRHQEADKMAMQLSRLLRANIDPEMKLTRTLKEELDFVRDYIAIEQIRANHAFKNDLVINPDVNVKIPVPRMIIQLYVENAIKHGLRPKGEGGKLEIRVAESQKKMARAEATARSSERKALKAEAAARSPEPEAHNEDLFIVVEDNGIGREAATQQGSQGTGQGIKVMSQFLELVNQMNKQEIVVTIIDLKDENGGAAGTRVEIRIPGGMMYDV